MSLPKYKDVDLALLVELVREGVALPRAQTYQRVARHFLDLTEADMAITRKDGRTKAFQNVVHWARNHLRVRGLLASDQVGVWKVNEFGRQALIDDLVNRGASKAAASSFIDEGARLLPDLLGPKWSTPARTRPVESSSPADLTPVAHGETPGGPESRRNAELGSDTEGTLDSVRQAIIRRLNAMPGYEFEQVVARVLDGVGLRDAQVVGRSGDEGVDIIAYLHSPFVVAKVAVQVKRQTQNVGPKDISYLRDRWSRRADRLLFVTTADFTAGAREVAEEQETHVALVNGRHLVEVMLEFGLGVRQSPVVTYELEEDFFSG